MESLLQNKNLIIGISVVLAVLIVAFAVVATIFGWWPVLLDIVLIVTALVSMGLLGALIYAVISFTRTLLDVKDELIPVLNSLKTTTSAVRESAKTATSFGVSPAVRTASALAGAGEMATILFGRGKAQKRADKRQKRRMEIERQLAKEGQLDGNR